MGSKRPSRSIGNAYVASISGDLDRYYKPGMLLHRNSFYCWRATTKEVFLSLPTNLAGTDTHVVNGVGIGCDLIRLFQRRMIAFWRTIVPIRYKK